MQSVSTQRKGQKGNVLFLILIAVALFAALSYAVTQSSRSGGDAGRETNSVNTASVIQFANQVRTAATRMAINGRTANELSFNVPGTGTAPRGYSAITDAAALARLVFHPSGGAVPYQQISADIAGTGFIPHWIFTMEFRVPDIGTTPATGILGNDVVMAAVGVSEPACLNINQQLNDITTGVVPISTAAALTVANQTRWATNDAAGAAPADPAVQTLLFTGATADPLLGRSAGCFRATATGPYTFYMVVAER